MSCTYIDLCPSTPDGRYMQPLNVNLSCTERLFCPPSSYFISGVIVCSTASRMWSSKGSWMTPSHMLRSLLSGSTWRCSNMSWRICDKRSRLNRDELKVSWRGSKPISSSNTARVSSCSTQVDTEMVRSVTKLHRKNVLHQF